MLKKIFTLTGLFFACLQPIAAQKLHFAVEGGLQHSWIPDYTIQQSWQAPSPGTGYSSQSGTDRINWSFREKPGFFVSGSLSYALNKRWQLFSTLGLQLLRFTPEVFAATTSSVGCISYDAAGNMVVVPCSGQDSGVLGSAIGYSRLGYMKQDVGVSYLLLPRLQLNAGIGANYRIIAHHEVDRWEMVSSDNGQPSMSTVRVTDRSGDGFRDILFGYQFGAAYTISEKLALIASFQHNITSVYYARSFNRPGHYSAKPNLMHLGVQYKLRSW